MTVVIYNSENWFEYEAWFARNMANIDIYYYPAFLKIESRLIQGEPIVFVASNSAGEYVVYPFIKRPLNYSGFDGYFDITSPYGYCGPASNSKNQNFFKEAERHLCQYLEKQKVVTEFIRYHYQYNQDLKFRENITNSQNRTIVIVDVSQSWETVWMNQYSTTNRNLIRKMEKEGYTFMFSEDDWLYREFIKMYYKTMENANADSSFYFPEDYFISLKKELGKHLKFCLVEKCGIIYSASLFFVTSKIATYYLSARNIDFPKVPGVNFMLSKAIQAFQATPVEYVNLGGGTNNSHDNSLFKFKLNFSKNTSEFWVGKRVLLPEIYRELKLMFISSLGETAFKEKEHILQFYRL